MPTYEYECQNCGHIFELFQKITDKPIETCPKCAKKVKRLISSGCGIIFKGSGFYATDFRKKPQGKTGDTQKNTCPMIKKGCNACAEK